MTSHMPTIGSRSASHSRIIRGFGPGRHLTGTVRRVERYEIAVAAERAGASVEVDLKGVEGAVHLHMASRAELDRSAASPEPEAGEQSA